jgi:hypothetical protein
LETGHGKRKTKIGRFAETVGHKIQEVREAKEMGNWDEVEGV